MDEPSTRIEELVLRAARARVTGNPRPLQQAASEYSGEWTAVFTLAERHGIRPIVGAALERHCFEYLTDDARDYVRSGRRGLRIHNTFVENEFVRVADRFREAGLRFLGFKGPVLTHQAYGDMSMRRYSDVDVLIQADRFPQASRLLRNLGYREAPKVRDRSGPGRSIYLALSKQCPFVKGGHSFALDLHWRIMPPRYACEFDFEDLWQRSDRVQMRSSTVPCAAAEQMLLILCLQGAKNHWTRLKYVCDVAELIRAHEDLDVEDTLREARSLGGLRILIVGLVLASEILDFPFRPETHHAAEHYHELRELGAEWAGALLGSPDRFEPNFERRARLQFLLQDSWSQRGRYVWYAFLRRLFSMTGG